MCHTIQVLNRLPKTLLGIMVVNSALASLAKASENDPAISAIINQIEEQYENDPYLTYQPSFAYSLPIQILLTGIILSLVAVLLIHLLFTGQYHWPLAKLNYVLQLSGVGSLLITLIFTLYIVLAAVFENSRQWPYMLNYIAFAVPPTYEDPDWPMEARAAWYAMEATTSALAHITHIQFLTLLYPSRLEARLIFLLLGPLALASSACSFVDLSNDPTVHDLGDSIRNVCNAALSLIFTTALLIWGLLINRRQAWRTEGGTAAFGGGAIALALSSLALNFLTIPHLPPVWLPGLMWAVVLWQSFLGWWWWVGSGVGLETDSKRRKRTKRNKGRTAIEKAAMETATANEQSTRFTRWRLGVTSALRYRRADAEPEPDQIQIIPPSESSHGPAIPLAPSAGDVTTTTTTTTTTAIRPPFTSSPLQFLHWCWQNLRHAHVKATRIQAAQTVERRVQVYGIDGADPGTAGWSLGAFGLREREQVGRRQQLGGHTTPDTMSTFDEDMTSPPVLPVTHTHPSATPSSWSWWGPFRHWRLRDRTTYD